MGPRGQRRGEHRAQVGQVWGDQLQGLQPAGAAEVPWRGQLGGQVPV